MNRKLLYFNLAIDSKDTSLGFAIKWIETISNNYDQVDVVTLRLSTNPNFSNNVNVYGPKKQDKKIIKYQILCINPIITRTSNCKFSFWYMADCLVQLRWSYGFMFIVWFKPCIIRAMNTRPPPRYCRDWIALIFSIVSL